MGAEKYNYTVPTYVLCPIFNGDCTGLSDDDAVNLSKFEKRIDGEHKGKQYYWAYDDADDENGGESFFTWSNDVDALGGDCVELTLLVYN